MPKTARIELEAPRKAWERKPAKRGGATRNLAAEHVSYNLESGDSATCPFIRLKGRWLERSGSTVGSRVVVTVRRGCLTIRPLR